MFTRIQGFSHIFDTRNGYFDAPPLGNWRLVFVRYTDAATMTLFGWRELRVIAERKVGVLAVRL